MRYFPIWEKEVLNYYPESYENFPAEWVSQIKNLNERQRWQIDSKQSFTSIKDSKLEQIFSEIQSFEKFLDRPSNDDISLTNKERSGIKVKKQHEIEKLISFIKHQKNQEPKMNSFIDIGGGKGHLSRLLSNKLQMSGTCIEMNPDFVKKGKQLSKESDLKFKCISLPEEDLIQSKEILATSRRDGNNDLCLGLHTCGPLANTILKSCVENQQNYLLNFGCCYLKLKPGSEVGISGESKKFPLPLSKYALTLATRAHTGLTWGDYLMKKR